MRTFIEYITNRQFIISLSALIMGICITMNGYIEQGLISILCAVWYFIIAKELILK